MVKKTIIKQLIIIVIILFLIEITFTTSVKSIKTKNDSNKNYNIIIRILYVGGNGPGNISSIQKAINAADEGYTIFVYNGIYNENIIINKSIELIGENKQKTIIDGNGKDNVIAINSEGTIIDSFSIINATGSGINKIFKAGIRVTGPNNTIKNNIIKNNNAGIFIRRATNTTILNNQLYDNGIILSPYDVTESHVPISKESFIHTIENNTVNVKKILYLKNQRDIQIPSDTGQLIAFNCTNLTIQNINFTKCDAALLFAYTNKCKIKNSTFIDDAEIWLMESNNNIFEHNTMIKNFHGVTLDYHSKNNILKYNNFSNNQLMGIMLEQKSNFNIIEENNLMNNNYSNAFIQNSFMNKWKNNYWDDWIGLKYPFLRFLPKILFGWLSQEIKIISLFNFDWHPATEPYDIKNVRKTIYVDDDGEADYTRIQDAIDNASDGDMIYVYNGSYFENIDINKKINLLGENKLHTIIDGNKVGENKSLIMVTSEYVKISGFTVQNAKGIDGRAMFFLNQKGNGYTRDNVITDNIVRNCSYGVMIVNPVNNVVVNNSLYGCGIGPYITHRPYFKNTFENNTVNDKPILFYENKNNICIDGEDVGSIGLYNCKNVEIRNLKIENITVGIDISFSSRIKVINNTICNTGRGGIYVHNSHNCIFQENTFINDNWGIFLRKSNFNKIQKNNFINITMSDWFSRSYFNKWDGNYWGESSLSHRKIFGKIGLFENVPWYNFDWHPAKEPYDI